MNYGSVCSGIEAATVAWHPLGWRAAWYSEIEPFPCAVLAHHYPETPNLGDMTKFKEWPEHAIDLLVGGTPCQSFSVAGLRKGLDDPRGNLMLTYLALAGRYRPRWVVWENVPGVLSIDNGRAFGTFLGGLGQLGYGFAYRVLDAQHFGVPQRRRRVFVVGHLGNWRAAAAVLFERHSLQGHLAPRRKAGAGVAASLASSSGGCNDPNRAGAFVPKIAHPIKAKGNDDHREDSATYICMESGQGQAGIGIGIGCTLNASHEQTIIAQGAPAIAFQSKDNGRDATEEQSPTILRQTTGVGVGVGSTVRRLTPKECERLQGFPDDYTLIPWRGKGREGCPDGPRYKALGNSMAVPVMRWIGERIEKVESVLSCATTSKLS